MKKWEEMTLEARESAIADKVMGYDIGLYPSGIWIMWDSSGLDTPIPHYTRDWNAAWQVLQHMVEKHCIIRDNGNFDEVWWRFCSELKTSSTEPNIFLWIVTWTPELISRSAFLAVTGGETYA